MTKWKWQDMSFSRLEIKCARSLKSGIFAICVEVGVETFLPTPTILAIFRDVILLWSGSVCATPHLQSGGGGHFSATPLEEASNGAREVGLYASLLTRKQIPRCVRVGAGHYAAHPQTTFHDGTNLSSVQLYSQEGEGQRRCSPIRVCKQETCEYA